MKLLMVSKQSGSESPIMLNRPTPLKAVSFGVLVCAIDSYLLITSKLTLIYSYLFLQIHPVFLVQVYQIWIWIPTVQLDLLLLVLNECLGQTGQIGQTALIGLIG